MEEIRKKLKEKYGSMRTEIVLMLLFVLAFIILNGRELAREASVIYGSGKQSAMPQGSAEHAENESELETETEGVVLTPAELVGQQEEQTEEPAEKRSRETDTFLQQRLLVPMTGRFRIPMAMPEEKELAAARQMLQFHFINGGQGETGVPANIVEYRSFEWLKRLVQNRIADYDGEWSVYARNLKTDESFVINDQPMKSASVMKLFIMGAAYKAIEAGDLEHTEEVTSLLNLMITESDNEASNQLLYRLGNSSYADGIEKVDAFIDEYGFSDMTVEYNGFNNSATVIDSEHSNQVSAKDCGKLLEDIYRRSWVNRSTGAEIEQMMLNQKTRYKIPAGLPEGVLCGNKTGEMDTTENDAAIIYGEKCDYILVVLSSDWGNKDQAIRRIADLSELVYEYLN